MRARARMKSRAVALDRKVNLLSIEQPLISRSAQGPSLTAIERVDIIKFATHVCRIVKSNDAHERLKKHAKAERGNGNGERPVSGLSIEWKRIYETEG